MNDAIFEDALKNEPLTEKAQKQLDAIAAVVPITLRKSTPPYFPHLTGKMLRKLVDAGTVVFRGPDEGWDYDSDVFKGGNDEESLEFLEETLLSLDVLSSSSWGQGSTESLVKRSMHGCPTIRHWKTVQTRNSNCV